MYRPCKHFDELKSGMEVRISCGICMGFHRGELVKLETVEDDQTYRGEPAWRTRIIGAGRLHPLGEGLRIVPDTVKAGLVFIVETN